MIEQELIDAFKELDVNEKRNQISAEFEKLYYLLDSIHEIQTLITCTGVDEFVNHRFSINKVFRVTNGQAANEN